MNKKKIIFNIIKLFIIIALFLIVGIVSYVVWAIWFSGPSITVHEKEGSIFVYNLFLGEYDLGFTEVTITDKVTGKKLLHASKNDGKNIGQIEFSSNVNLATELKKNGWDVSEPDGSFILKSGESYHFSLRGNNGSGHLNIKNIVLTIP